MIAAFLTLPLLPAAAAGVYYYYWLKRIAKAGGIEVQKKPPRAVLLIAAVVIAGFAANVWGFGAVLVYYHLAFALCLDFVNLILKRTGRGGRRWRRLYTSGLLSVLATVLVIGYGYWNMNHVQRTDYTITTDKTLREEGYRIALISDLHYGTTMHAETLAAYCREIEAAEPDLLVLCGDIVDERTSKKEMQEAFHVLSGVKTEFGTYYVYGNHDRAQYSKKSDYTPEELRDAVESSGIQILADRSVTIQDELTLIGREDRKNRGKETRMTSEELLEEVKYSRFLVMIDHQPRDLELNASLGCDLTLSGHTHGGQIWPVGEVSSLVGFGELNYGCRKIGGSYAIVSSGMAGWGYPVRTGKHSEYVIVEVKND